MFFFDARSVWWPRLLDGPAGQLMDDPVGQLWGQHTLLRAALVRFETACEDERIPAGRTTCDRLMKLLRAHIQQEGQLAVRFCQQRRRVELQELAQLAVEHYTEQEYLRVVHRCLTTQRNGSWESIRFPIQRAAAELRRHLDEQEHGLFPLLASVPAGAGALRSHAQWPRRLNRMVPARVPIPLRRRWPHDGAAP